jgi:hypothetical protein
MNKKKCHHSYVMYGNKVRTVYTPMICIYCGNIIYNDKAIERYEKSMKNFISLDRRCNNERIYSI